MTQFGDILEWAEAAPPLSSLKDWKRWVVEANHWLDKPPIDGATRDDLILANELLHLYWRELNSVSRTKLDEFGIVTGGAVVTIGSALIFGPAAFFAAPVYAVAAKLYDERHKRNESEIFEVIGTIKSRITKIQRMLIKAR